jgi:hypothetical protein
VGSIPQCVVWHSLPSYNYHRWPMVSLDGNNPLDLLAITAASLESSQSPACSVTPDVDNEVLFTLKPLVITDKIMSRVTPSDDNAIAQMLKLRNKHHVSAEFASIKPRNVKKCFKAPLHFLGGYRSWDHVIPALFH